MCCLYYTYIIHNSSAHHSGDCFIMLNLHIKEFNPLPMCSFEFPIHFFEMKQEAEKQ